MFKLSRNADDAASNVEDAPTTARQQCPSYFIARRELPGVSAPSVRDGESQGDGISCIAAAAFVVIGVWLIAGWGGVETSRAVSDVGSVAFGSFAVACAGVVAWSSHGRIRASWICLMAGLAAWFGGDTIWGHFEQWGRVQGPVPSVADGAYLLFRSAHAWRCCYFPSAIRVGLRSVYDRLTHALQLQNRGPGPLAVLKLDLNHFKLVNGTHGHQAGEALLIGIAERLPACLRASDTVSRLGGDEFAISIEGGADSPSVVAKRVTDEPFAISGHELSIKCSVGLAVASAEDRGVSADVLLQQADMAMYSAKRAAAGAVHTFARDTQPMSTNG